VVKALKELSLSASMFVLAIREFLFIITHL